MASTVPAFRVSDWSGTAQRGNPREEYSGKRDGAAFERRHAQTNKDTRGVFGDHVSIYDIQDAVDDKATVPIYYESRLAKLDINSAAIEQLNQDVEEVLEDEEDVSTREETKSRWAELTKLVGAKERLKEVAADIVKHFGTRTATLEGKAMIVCMSRDICAALFDELVALRPEWAGTHSADPTGTGYNVEDGALRVVMTGNATDKAALQQHLYTKQQRKRLEKRFKDPKDPLRLVIVRDMWLTGFDAPCCHTMYVDKPMQGHNLIVHRGHGPRQAHQIRGGQSASPPS